MPDDKRPTSFQDFDARLGKLRPEKKPETSEPEPPSTRAQFGSGLQAGVEVVAGVGFGLLVGWALDRWLGTMPLFLIVFFMLGAAAGVLNAYRHLRRMGDEAQGGP
jgi:ATP synthase protein I